ncbi:MAG: hypothetical protein J6Y80_06940, partial [Victivallales bacterium]|nr:hypothetical protein [Victivallales bacterium]
MPGLKWISEKDETRGKDANAVTVTAMAVVTVPGRRSAFPERKTAFKKRQMPLNGPQKPSTGLSPFLGIYTHGSKKASKLAIFRGVSFQSI